jgi:tetratricopeptide (TPR) repeat protein
MANALWSSKGDTEKAKVHHEEALKILETEPESIELASLYEDMAGIVAMGATGKIAEALSLGEKAVELAKKLNAHEVLAHSYMWLGEISDWLGNRKKACECFERALKIALDNGYLETAAWAYDDLSHSHEVERERLLEYREKGFELAKKVGSLEWISLIGLHLAQNYANMGNMSKAVSMAEESVSLNRKIGNMVQLNWSLSNLGNFYEILGETEKSMQCYNEALSISQRLDDWQSLCLIFEVLGWSHFRNKEYAKAKELMEKAFEIAEKHTSKDLVIQYGSQFIIRIYIELGEIEKAKSLIDSMQEFALKGKDRTRAALAHALRGMLLRAQKKWEESIEQFEKSVQELEALGARQWNVYDFAELVLSEFARVYLERDQEGDREKADKLLNQALEIFQKMDAKKDIEKIIAKKKLLTA